MSLHPPTAAQRRAADPRRSVWVTANAGTGKTRVLTDRVLRLLLDGAHPESILCLTFTKAAAAEMTHRLEQKLASWAVERDDAQLSEEIGALSGEPPPAAVLARARRLFARVLDLPRGLAITTIHSFCQSLLRRFPLEAGVAPHFETIDERTTAELFVEARETVLGPERLRRPALARAVEMLAGILTDGSLTEALGEVIGDRLRLARAKRRFGGIEGLLAAIDEKLEAPPGVEPHEHVLCACADGIVDHEGLQAAANALLASGVNDRKRAERILPWLNAVPADRLTLFEDYKRAFLTADGEGIKNLAAKAVEDWARSVLVREQARILRVCEQQKAIAIARRTQALLLVADSVIEVYERQKERQALLDYDDLIERARALLADPQRTEWVFYKLDQSIDHVLVDEAQDTSPAQWEIIERLTDEFFAGEGASDRPRTLFVVGDEKQSIYSFQGADLANFRAVRARILERAAAAGRPVAGETLDLSFRSVAAVLETVDRVLALPALTPAAVQPGERVQHDTVRRNQAGLVELLPLAEPGQREGIETSWPLPSEPRIVDEPQRRVAEAVARTIRRWLDEGEPLEALGRPLRPGDILVLVSRRGTVQDLLIRALKRHDVPVAGADRLALGEHIAVMDLVALGRAILLPEDDLNLAALLKSPLLGLGEEELFELCWQRGQTSLMERLRAFARDHGRAFAVAYERLAGWSRRADFMPPFEFFTRVLGEDGGRRRLLERLGPDAAEPIEAFLGQALAYERGHPSSLEGFLHWLTLDDQQLKRDPEQAQDLVRVMTVHGSKGLEAPVVILADAGPQQSARSGRLVWCQEDDLPLWRASKEQREPVSEAACADLERRQQEERLRLLYVALTRARDRLCITGWETRNGDLDACWHGLARQALQADERAVPITVEIGRSLSGEGRRLALGAAAPPAPALPQEAPPARALPAWAASAAPEEPTPSRPLAPSRLGADEPPPRASSGVEAAGRYRFGLLAHKLLQLAPALPETERPAAISGYLERNARDLDAATRQRLAREVLGVMALPELAPVFSPAARAEQAIAGLLGQTAVSGQIDRLLVTEKEVVLVDFKTGRAPPAGADGTSGAMPGAYVRQMAAYRALLRRLYPGRDVRCALVWTENGTVTWLPAPLLDEVESRLAGLPAATAP
ncbi:double-strand break repair helicase AddA [Geminicoccaceae bacterium 1502E]|nr:double-strand break repair helicase AddA [Geminicoccaceae bacterium 1502E]